MTAPEPPTRPAGSALAALAPLTLTLLRIGSGILFMQHGAQKLFGWLGGKGPVPLLSQYGIAGMLEFYGGILLILGLATRVNSVLLTGLMIVAYVTAHMPDGGWPVQNRGELALLYALIFVFFAGNGAGPWSLDGWLSQRRKR